MNEMITVRDSDIVAAEINTIKEDTRRIMIANAIRIGGKLMEAKSMVPFGEWGKWLEEKVDYSQSTANNLMQLYREYGENQESLFDTWTKSEAFANLTYSQHMALLALPFSDRQEFAESHDAENMSTRELEKAVREELARAKADLEESEAKLEESERRAADLAESMKDSEAECNELRKRADAAIQAQSAAEKAKMEAIKTLENKLDLLEKAQAAEAAAKAELKKARENPDIPDSIMEQMRREAEVEAAQKATAALQKQLDAAKAAADEAARGKETAERSAREAEAKLAAAQKQIKMADPDIIAYNALAQQLINDYNVIDGYRLKVAAGNPDAGERLKQFQMAMLNQWQAALQET